MKPNFHYAPVTTALANLKKQGFTVDFNLEENCISCHNAKFTSNDFAIKEVYRYEGNSDPADEATVYGIETGSGIKGVLVTGYGISSDGIYADILKKLHD